MHRPIPLRPHPLDPRREAPWTDDVLEAPYWVLWEASMLGAGWGPSSGATFGPDDDRTDADEPE